MPLMTVTFGVVKLTVVHEEKEMLFDSKAQPFHDVPQARSTTGLLHGVWPVKVDIVR